MGYYTAVVEAGFPNVRLAVTSSVNLELHFLVVPDITVHNISATVISKMSTVSFLVTEMSVIVLC
jgi:hypothetical protein